MGSNQNTTAGNEDDTDTDHDDSDISQGKLDSHFEQDLMTEGKKCNEILI